MSKLQRYKLVGGMVFADDERGDYLDADDAEAEIKRLRYENAALKARVAELETPTDYWTELNEETSVVDLGQEVNDADCEPGSAFEVTPLHRLPKAWYGVVPDPEGEWDDDYYADWRVSVIGPFPTRDAAEAEADRITAERRAAWKARQGKDGGA